MLSFQNVTKIFSGGNKAVNNLSLDVKDGEIFGFLGPNGAGKSTSIKIACGVLYPTEGDVLINGESITGNSVAAKMNIGYVSDNHAMYDRLTLMEYLSFIGSVYNVGKTDLERRSRDYLEMFGLSSVSGVQINTFSHGMKQKTAVIAALIHDPRVWILDEPLTGLDPQSAYDLKRLMRKHADDGNTVFFSSHVIDVVEKICDRVAIIKKGSLVAVGTLEELMEKDKNKNLEEVFLDLTSDQSIYSKDDFFNE